MNSHPSAAQDFRAKAQRDREARAERPARRPFANFLALLCQPRVA